MLNFSEFCDYAQMQVGDALRESGVNEVIVREVTKNNGQVLHGMCALTKDNPVAATIYLEDFFSRYQKGTGLDLVVSELIATVEHHLETPSEYANIGNQILDPDFAKDRIVMKLVNAQKNAELLAHAPYTMKEDLAIIYRVLLGKDGDHTASITVNDELMKCWDMSLEELHGFALENTKNLLPVRVRTMNEVMWEMMAKQGMPDEVIRSMIPEMPEGDVMHIITNSSGIDGAASIVYDEPLSALANKLGGDLFVLPSSTHEVIVVSAQTGDPEELAMMVQEINGSEVSPEEQLSNHVYRYDAKAHSLSLADASTEELQAQFVAERAKYLEPEHEAPERHAHR